MKQNVRLLRMKNSTATTTLNRDILTYQHPECLPEGTHVIVDVSGYEYEGKITYEGKAYDGVCKPILEVLSLPPPMVVV